MSSLIANKVKTNSCFVSIKLFIVRCIYVCHCFQIIPRIQQYQLPCSIFFFAYKLFASNKTCSLDLYMYSGELQTTTVLFTCNFTQGWLNSYWSLSALCYPFVVQHEQFNESSLTRRFVFSPSRELYRNHIVAVYSAHTIVCAFAYLFMPFSLVHVVVGLLFFFFFIF